MQIGKMRIDPVIDGEVVFPGTEHYPGTCVADWLEHGQFLEPVGGHPLHISTIGGYLVRYDERVVLVDAGGGPSARMPFAIGGFRSSLTSLGVARADVTDVIFTHLHFDHVGWAAVEGEVFFPNATYRVDQRDWDHFCAPGYQPSPATLAAVNSPDDLFTVKLKAVEDRMEFFLGEQEVIPGISALEASGHTPGETALELRSDGARGLLLGDVVHAQPELMAEGPGGRHQWRFAPHTDPARAADSVDRLQRMILEDAIPFAAAHFAGLRWAALHRTDKGLVWEDLG
jgi:glyoxylase-like metal-dependent hydrolase (beta-lactamase superfamily II)